MAAPIEHIVVLMLENCSFDSMLGWLKKAYGLFASKWRTIAGGLETPPSVVVSEE